jgi:hypothetical protein
MSVLVGMSEKSMKNGGPATVNSTFLSPGADFKKTG